MRVSLDRAIVLRQPWAQAVVDGAFPAMVWRISTNIRGHVGVLASNNPDPAGFRAEDQECPLGAIVGAVELADCITVKGNARAFLADTFGAAFAGFYPDHFLPDEPEKHIWVFTEAIPAQTVRPWGEAMPRTWARCNTWIEGQPFQLIPEAVAHA